MFQQDFLLFGFQKRFVKGDALGGGKLALEGWLQGFPGVFFEFFEVLLHAGTSGERGPF